MKIVIASKDPVIIETETGRKYKFLYHNLKIDNWEKFIEYVKQYKNK